MIEVEKKFIFGETFLAVVKEKGVFLKKIVMHDIYFDTADYKLTLQNIWLRKRDGKFELKVGLKNPDKFSAGRSDQYVEIDNEEEIFTKLGLPLSDNLEASLKKENYIPFCSYKTTREKYTLNGLTIDLDVADFGGLVYQVGECEVMVSSNEEIPAAEDKIKKFLNEFNVASSNVPTKLMFYLYHKDKKHYQALINSGLYSPNFKSSIKPTQI
jgi:adenylate cyclase class IV